MNVAALLQDSPSDDHRRRQQQHREREREQQQLRSASSEHPRDRHGAQQQQQQPPPPPPPPHQTPPQSLLPPVSSAFHPQSTSRHPRPRSPPQSYQQQDYGLPPRLPPIMAMPESFDLKHRRSEQDVLPQHEIAARENHRASLALGPPGTQPPLLEHRSSGSRSQPPPRDQPPTHLHPHGHTHPSTPSSMYMPPPSSRHSSNTKHGSGSPSVGPGMPPPPGHGSIPLFPTPVGPGVGSGNHSSGPPPHHDHRSPNYNEPSVMYSGHHHAPPGASIIGAFPPQPRHRRNGSGGHNSQNASPAMSSLQRPMPFDERGDYPPPSGPGSRNGPQLPPPSQSGSVLGPPSLPSTGPGGAPSNASTMRNGPPLLTGPGSHVDIVAMKEREREREQERDARLANNERRDREMWERDQRRGRGRERQREEERMAQERSRFRELESSGLLPSEALIEADREREQMRKMQQSAGASPGMREHPQVWSRFAFPRTNEEKREREIEMQREREFGREMEFQREREIAKLRDLDERRILEARFRGDWEYDMEMASKHGRARSIGRLDAKERNRERERMIERENDRSDREMIGRRASKEMKKIIREDPHWMPDSREARAREMERERMQMQAERDMREEADSMRLRQQSSGPLHHHHHIHRHHHPSSSSAPPVGSGSSKSSKSMRPEQADISMMSGGVMDPRGMPPPFGPPVPERQAQGSSGSHKSLSKPTNGMVGPPGQPQGPQHLHPSNHIHIHPHQHSLPPSMPISFQHRRSPPPSFASILVAPGSSSFVQAPSPPPPLLPTLPPLHLGTFVYPRTPFPFNDFPIAPYDSAISTTGPITITEKEVREIHAIVLIPGNYLPTKLPKRPRIWGGAPIPNFVPLFASPELVHHLQSGMPHAFRRPHPLELRGTRRVYTDDSDLFLCALHAGWITWGRARAASKSGKDLKLEVRLTRESRFVGGLGSHYRGGESDEESVDGDDDDGTTLLSSGWGNSHDGAGIEIVTAKFVKKGTAHESNLRNRNQRLLEYAERRALLDCGPSFQHKRRREAPCIVDVEDSQMLLDVYNADQALSISKTVVSGGYGWSDFGYRYEPEAIRSVLFPESAERFSDERPLKKQRLELNEAQHGDADRQLAKASSFRPAQSPDIIVETVCETFLISSREGSEVSDDGVQVDPSCGAKRYTITLLPRTRASPELSSKKAEPTTLVTPLAEKEEVVLTTETKQVPETAVAVADAPENLVNGLASSDVPEGKPSTAANVPCEDISSVEQVTTTLPAETPKVNGINGVNGNHETPSEKSGDTPPKPEPAPQAKELEHSSTSESISGVQSMDISPEPEIKASKPAVELIPSPTVEPVSIPDAEPAVGVVDPEPVPAKEQPAFVVTLEDVKTPQVLQRGLGKENFDFSADGISILSSIVENGMRKGWKIEARRWRWAEPMKT